MVNQKRSIDWGEAIIPILTLLFGIAYFIQVKGASWTAIYWPTLIAIVLALLWL
ncbi:MAG: hypothetical protein JRI44_13505, partial [Deltaproteobacteria bacterium]|nr:hypothetical protein [Deltaproteobacteria bacterium]